MSNPLAAYRYKTSCARIVGRAHVQNGTPCQDYVSTRSGRGLACIALADGAGSRPLSEFGAEAAVKATIRFVSQHFDALWTQAGDDAAAVAQQLLDYCLAALQRKARRLKCTPDDLACTLLFVAHQQGRYLSGHLGDGFIARLSETGGVDALSHPDNGEFANTTVFVTDPTAPRRLRIARGEGPVGFAIMSDGTAESLYQKASRTPAAGAIQKLLNWNAALPRGEMEKILAANLEQAFAKRSSDDCSIALLSASQRGAA